MALKPVVLPVDTTTGMSLMPGGEYFVTPSSGGAQLLGHFNRAVCRCVLEHADACSTPIIEIEISGEPISLAYVPGMEFTPTEPTLERLEQRRATRDKLSDLAILAGLPAGATIEQITREVITKLTLVADRLVALIERVDALDDRLGDWDQ